jgi:7-carboxy-7-deazaguanine synthase (Cx14CxxC type)
MYTVKEIYTTLQGEGAQVGRAAVFLRFAGCNLWSGLESGRERAICQFCDTDFVGIDGPGGGKFASAEAVAAAVSLEWQKITAAPPASTLGGSEPKGIRAGLPPVRRYVVCTGGEPLLQLDEPLIEALHAQDFEVGIETNGTLTPPSGIDWICVSPKADALLVLRAGDELKLVYPQAGAEPSCFERLDFHNFFLQPMDGPDQRANIAAAARYCLSHPQWRLSLQTHKLIGLR